MVCSLVSISAFRMLSHLVDQILGSKAGGLLQVAHGRRAARYFGAGWKRGCQW